MNHPLLILAVAAFVVTNIVVLTWTVSQWRKAERARASADEKLQEARLILDRIPVAVWSATADGRFFAVNNWLIEYTGLERAFFEDKSGKYAEQQREQPYLHVQDRDRMIGKWLAMRETAPSYEDEFRMRRKDGVFHWFKTIGQPNADENGRNIRWFGALVDIDRQKQVEEELRRAEHDLRLMVETIPAFVWVASANGQYFYVNQRLLDYSGATAEEFKGEGWASFLHPDDIPPARAAWQKALETGQPYEWSYRMRRADGVHEWFSVLAQLLRDEDGAPLRWYGVDFNIDAQKRAEERLGDTQARLSRSSQFATVAEFAAAVAHEVTQPLFGANLNVEACLSWLAASPPDIDRARQSASLAIEDGKDAAAVVHKVRALFRKSEPAKEPIDIRLAIGEVIRLMRDPLTRTSTFVMVNSDEHLPPVHADRLQIQQVIWNLVHNAIDAMDGMQSDKVVMIEVRSTGAAEVSVAISDRGSGFSDAERAFEAFFTTKSNGMGMGLSICKSIIDAHGGHLSARPNHELGTTLTFRIPTGNAAISPD